MRLGIAPAFFFEGMDTEVERIISSALAKLESAGAVIVRAELPELLKAAPSIALAIEAFETLPSLSAFLSEHGAGVTVEEVLAQLGANTAFVFKAMVLPPNGISADDYQKALQMRDQLKAATYLYFQENNIDALVFPPVLCPAPALGDNREIEINGKKVSIIAAIARNTALGPCASLPGLVLPAGMTATGLPVGIEFEGMPGRDRELLAIGLSVEGVLGRLPPPTIKRTGPT